MIASTQATLNQKKSPKLVLPRSEVFDSVLHRRGLSMAELETRMKMRRKRMSRSTGNVVWD